MGDSLTSRHTRVKQVPESPLIIKPTMAIPYVEDEADVFDYTLDWREAIDNQSPASIHMSNDVQEATLLGYVSANKIFSAIRHFCGFAEADTAAPWLLRRSLPQWHPQFPQLRSYDVSIVELVPLNSEDVEIDTPKKVSPFSQDYFSANYKEALLSVRYRNFLYRFREDADIATAQDEWRRYTFVPPQQRTEALTVTGGMSQLTFAETSVAAGGPSIAAGKKSVFGAPIAALLTKKGIVVNWYDVPWEYLSSNEDIFWPTKLDAIQGKVNTDVFMDQFDPGTLLADGYSATFGTWAVRPEDALDPLRKVTLALNFTWFDPTRGAAAPIARGHNLMPWSGNGVGVAPGGDAKFYLATRNGETDGDRLIPGAAFSSIYTHVSAP